MANSPNVIIRIRVGDVEIELTGPQYWSETMALKLVQKIEDLNLNHTTVSETNNG